MYKTIVVFSAGYLTHKHVAPILAETLRKTAIKLKEEQDSSPREIHPQKYLEQIMLPSRAEAVEVLEKLRELVQAYGHASFADLYELVGISPSFTDHKWGWTDLRTAEVRPVEGQSGFGLFMPESFHTVE